MTVEISIKKNPADTQCSWQELQIQKFILDLVWVVSSNSVYSRWPEQNLLSSSFAKLSGDIDIFMNKKLMWQCNTLQMRDLELRDFIISALSTMMLWTSGRNTVRFISATFIGWCLLNKIRYARISFDSMFLSSEVSIVLKALLFEIFCICL